MFSGGKGIFIDNVNVAKQCEKGSSRCFCEYCEEFNSGWQSETELEIHKIDTHGEVLKDIAKKAYSCKVCLKNFKNKPSLISHIKSKHLYSSPNARRVEREIYICDICSMIFFNKKVLVIHIAILHRPRKQKCKVECPKCGHTIRIPYHWAHLEKHAIHSASSCKICMTKFQNMSQLETHMALHPRYYHCNVTGYESSKESHFHNYLNKLEMDNSINMVRDLSGAVVKKVFEPKTSMDKYQYWYFYHNWRQFRGLFLPDTLKICILCREICSNLNEMRKHVSYVHMPKLHVCKTFVCSCGDEFSMNILLKHHLMKMKGDHKDAGVIETVGNSSVKEIFDVDEIFIED